MKIRLHSHPTKKLLWISDLHLDQVSSDRKYRFFDRLASASCDAVLITGDISIADRLPDHLAEISGACGARSVFFTTGNHDYFGSSFEKVDGCIADVCRRHPNLVVLGGGEIIKLSPNTALVGHRGWFDGRAGIGSKTMVKSPDRELIHDFRGLSKDEYFLKLAALGDESARYIRQVLPCALMKYKAVYVATHVPPFTQALRHGGNYCRMGRQPFFSNRAAGNAIFGIARSFPDHRIMVRAGHSHSAANTRMSSNLEIRVAGAQPGRPAFQEPILID
ncbi:metallophosphoesterase [Haloferula sp.]|uniref:metallophosphoesterase n=1 Tax=Haloferula sp. TaxID=2497595 RepID=UPI003C755D51